MKFIDPYSISCDRCDTVSEQKPDELLSLKASCPKCGNSFSAAGMKMRTLVDENVIWHRTLDAVFQIEEDLTVTFSESEIDGMETVADLYTIVSEKSEALDVEVEEAVKKRSTISQIERFKFNEKLNCPIFSNPIGRPNKGFHEPTGSVRQTNPIGS